MVVNAFNGLEEKITFKNISAVVQTLCESDCADLRHPSSSVWGRSLDLFWPVCQTLAFVSLDGKQIRESLPKRQQ